MSGVDATTERRRSAQPTDFTSTMFADAYVRVMLIMGGLGEGIYAIVGTLVVPTVGTRVWVTSRPGIEGRVSTRKKQAALRQLKAPRARWRERTWTELGLLWSMPAIRRSDAHCSLGQGRAAGT